MSWKDKWNFIKPKSISHKIDEDELQFYPVSVTCMFTLKEIAAPIARALAALFQSEENDVGATDETVSSNSQKDFTNRKIVEPVSMELARFRLDQKQRAIQDGIETLFSPSNAIIVARIIMDSLRDDFDRKKSEEQKDAEAQDLLDTIDGAMFQQLLTGLYEGNKKVFGPLASMVAQSKEMIQSRLRGLSPVSSEEASEDDDESLSQ
jgi:hypothetical protein